VNISPALKTLQGDPRWMPATQYFQALSHRKGSKATASEITFSKAFKGDPSLIILDTVMSLRTQYSALHKKLSIWKVTNANTPLAEFARKAPTSIAPQGGSVSKARQESIKGVAQAILGFGTSSDNDWERFVKWAKQAEALRYAHRLDPVGSVKGVGTAAFTYLLMRAGIDTIKPDVRVKQELVHSGLAASVQSLGDLEALVLAECMAAQLGVTRLWFDQLLWL